MNRSITSLIIATFMSCILLPAYAAGVYKWVDAKGITHYSDEAPASSTTQVTMIEVSATHPVAVDAENDYYSIPNQWMRLHEERIVREKLKLEKAKHKAAQQPPAPQIVYLNEPNANRYVVAYPGFIHPWKGHRRFSDKSKHYSGYMRGKHRQRKRPATLPGTGIKLGSYRPSGL